MSGLLTIGLTADPPRAMFMRDGEVSDELWNALGRNIAPGQAGIDGRMVSVPVEQLLRNREWLAEAVTSYQCDLEFTPAVAEFLERHAAERQEIDRLLNGGVAAVEAGVLLEGSRFIRPLRGFQRRDLEVLLSLSHGANFSVPGAGKTSVAYALYEAERVRERVTRMLVIGPLSAFDAWETEARQCLRPAPRVRAIGTGIPRGTEVLLVNYDKLTAGRYGDIAAWVSEQPCHLILDEAHRMKRGRSGERGTRCLDLAHLAVRRDILTGTPAPQHPSDFYALLEFLWPNQSDRIVPRSAKAKDPTPTTMHRLSLRLRPLFVRTRKQELGLRRPSLHLEPTLMPPIQRAIYETLRTRAARLARTRGRDRATLARMGGVTMYLLMAASNPGLLSTAIGGDGPVPTEWPSLPLDPDSEIGERIRNYNAYEIPAKFEKVASLVATNAAQGRKTLVWSNFPANLNELAATILAPHEPALIHGDIPYSGRGLPRTRTGELARFRTDPNCLVLLANPAAMSEGVSLHESCNDAIYLDRTFNAGQYLQSLDRIHRLGLAEERLVTMNFLACPDTIDMTVDRRLRIKARRLAQMLQDDDLVRMALPDEEEGFNEVIDVEDLRALFAHLDAPG